MATLQEVEDAIRKAHAKGNMDLVKRLGEARKQLLASGGAPAAEKSWTERASDYISGTINNFSDPEQWKHALTESPEAKAVMNPGQSIPDLLRTTSDFATLGQNDRTRSWLKGTDVEKERAETSAASGRLGSIDEAVNLGGAFLQPSSAAKYAAQGPGAIKSALAYGAEGAGLSGIEASLRGDDVLSAMGAGGLFGAGGSIAADATGSVANIFGGKGGPKYKTDEDFFADADSMNRSTAKGREMSRKKGRLELARETKPEGRSGFQRVQQDQKRTNRSELGIGRPEREALAEVAFAPNKKKTMTDAWGDTLKGGSFFGGIPIAAATFGVGPMAGAYLKGSARSMPDLDPLSYERYASSIRNAGEPSTPAFVDNATIDAWREALAKMSAGSQRGPR